MGQANIQEIQLNTGYVPQLDGVRAIAVAMVVGVHCIVVPPDGALAWLLRHTLSIGWIGVDLFFALSGFLITSILLRSKEEPHYFRNFYMRRLLRIFPVYYALLLLLWFTAPAVGLGAFSPAWPYFTYTSNLTSVFLNLKWEPMNHAWSLALEEQFYLLFPLLIFVLNRKTLKRVLWAVVALSPLLRFWVALEGVKGATYFATFCRLDVLAMGSLIAIALAERKSVPRTAARSANVMFMCLFVAVLALGITKQLDFRMPLFNLVWLSIVDGACAVLICVVLFGKVASLDALLGHRWLVAIGRVSYGIYLFHYPIFKIVDPVSRNMFGESWMRTVLTALGSIIATLLLAAASWRWFERPILRLKDRFSNVPPLPSGVNAYVSP